MIGLVESTVIGIRDPKPLRAHFHTRSRINKIGFSRDSSSSMVLQTARGSTLAFPRVVSFLIVQHRRHRDSAWWVVSGTPSGKL